MKRLKKARELYPDCMSHDYFEAPWDYEPIYQSFGTVVRADSMGSYQGDTQVLLYDDEKKQYGYICFGWGSCSCCDRLQGCASYEDIDDLIEDLYETIRWFYDDNEALTFFNTHEWDFDYDHSPEFVEFCREMFIIRVASGLLEQKTPEQIAVMFLPDPQKIKSLTLQR